MSQRSTAPASSGGPSASSGDTSRESAGRDAKTSRYALSVRFCETDLMGVVHHANYLKYFEAGRVDWLHQRGVSYDQWVKMGVNLPVVQTQLRYRKPAMFDDALIIETTCSEVTRVTVRFQYRVLRDELLLCEGETLLACVGETMAARRLPEDIRKVFLCGD